ncbi:hypothetical protein DFJ74DRAFT_641058 [Hyaloraphidium curvatum]|nr:hypothetical protein DFJ74DRAFT_641058 [Hyaloraphidium curvatum]
MSLSFGPTWMRKAPVPGSREASDTAGPPNPWSAGSGLNKGSVSPTKHASGAAGSAPPPWSRAPREAHQAPPIANGVLEGGSADGPEPLSKEPRRYPREFLLKFYDPSRPAPEGMERMEAILAEQEQEAKQAAAEGRRYPREGSFSSTRGDRDKEFGARSMPRGFGRPSERQGEDDGSGYRRGNARDSDLWDTPTAGSGGGSFGTDGAFKAPGSIGSEKAAPWSMKSHDAGAAKLEADREAFHWVAEASKQAGSPGEKVAIPLPTSPTRKYAGEPGQLSAAEPSPSTDRARIVAAGTSDQGIQAPVAVSTVEQGGPPPLPADQLTDMFARVSLPVTTSAGFGLAPSGTARTSALTTDILASDPLMGLGGMRSAQFPGAGGTFGALETPGMRSAASMQFGGVGTDLRGLGGIGGIGSLGAVDLSFGNPGSRTVAEQRAGMVTQMPTVPAPFAVPRPEIAPPKWVYRDPQGQIQGPFSHLEMQEWYSNGYFDLALPIKHADAPGFEPLARFLQRYGEVTPFKDEADEFVRRLSANRGVGLLQNPMHPGIGLPNALGPMSTVGAAGVSARAWPDAALGSPIAHTAAGWPPANLAGNQVADLAALAASGALSQDALLLLLQQLQQQQQLIDQLKQQELQQRQATSTPGIETLTPAPAPQKTEEVGAGGPTFSLFGESAPVAPIQAIAAAGEAELLRPGSPVEVPEIKEASGAVTSQPAASAAPVTESGIGADVDQAPSVIAAGQSRTQAAVDAVPGDKDKKRPSGSKKKSATPSAQAVEAGKAAELAANESVQLDDESKKAPWDAKQGPTTPSLKEIQEMEEKEREKQRKRKEQVSKAQLAEEVAKAQAEQEAAAAVAARLQQSQAAWTAPRGKKLSMAEIMAEEERREKERKAKLEAQRSAAAQSGLAPETWSTTRRFADAVGAPAPGPAGAWSGVRPMSIPGAAVVRPAVVIPQAPAAKAGPATPGPPPQGTPTDQSQSDWQVVGKAAGAQPSAKTGPAGGVSAPASRPGNAGAAKEKEKGPSEEFMKWCRTALKPLMSGGPVNADEFVAMLLSFSVNDTATVTMVCEDTLGFTTAIDPRKFAAEFISRRKADVGMAPAAKSGTGLEGFETVGRAQKGSKKK